MGTLSAVVVYALISTCAVAAQTCIGGELSKVGLSRELQMKVLHLHNVLRDHVAEGGIGTQPMAQNMKEMVWDHELANRAQMWANKCTIQHEEIRLNRKGQLFGQNISQKDKTWTGDEGEWEVLSKMIHEWFGEHSTSDNPFGSLHFSQIVWANTHKIGCGYSEYKHGGRTTAIFICNYFPSGNIVGKEPYTPGAKNCETHGLSASRSFKSLCAADTDDLDKLQFNTQYANTGYQQSSFVPKMELTGVERSLHSVFEHPTKLVNGKIVQLNLGDRQLVQPTNPFQRLNFQAAPSGQFQGYAARGPPTTYQSPSWNNQDQYSQSYFQQPQNMAFDAMLPYEDTNLNGWVPSYQTQTSGLPTNIQWTQSVPGYETVFQPKGPNIPRIFPSFQSNPLNFQAGQYYQPMNLYGNPSATNNLGGFLQKLRSTDQQINQVGRNVNSMGLPADSLELYRNGFNQPSTVSGYDNTQGVPVVNPLGISYTNQFVSPATTGLTNSGFYGMADAGNSNVYGFGNPLVFQNSNLVGVPPMFRFETVTENRPRNRFLFGQSGMDSMGYYDAPFSNSLGSSNGQTSFTTPFPSVWSQGDTASNQAGTNISLKGPSYYRQFGKPRYMRKY